MIIFILLLTCIINTTSPNEKAHQITDIPTIEEMHLAISSLEKKPQDLFPLENGNSFTKEELLCNMRQLLRMRTFAQHHETEQHASIEEMFNCPSCCRYENPKSVTTIIATLWPIYEKSYTK